MNRSIALIIAFSFALNSMLTAQFKEGFDPKEAKLLIAICNSYTFVEVFGSDSLIIPRGYKRIFTSKANELDNLFQVYEGNNIGIINFRSSTTQTSSWFENFYSAMIPAEGVMKVDGNNCSYKFAKNEDAAVHSGYALAVVLLSPVIIEQINELNDRGIFHIYITGHSQGGALAHMVHAYLSKLPEREISPMNKFKTYSFGNPMCGNEEFSIEYNEQFGETNMSYSVINSADIITKMPMHYKKEKNLYGSLFYKSWADLIIHGKNPNLKDKFLQVFKPALTAYVNSSNLLIEKLIASSYVSIDLPNYVTDINYFHLGTIRKLNPFPAPKIPVDTTKMGKKDIAKLKHDKDGNYYNKKSGFYQHTPYNYYIAILKKYFPEEYKALEYKYLSSKMMITD